MIHYHGTPITPIEVLYQLAGRHFCVSYADSRDVARAHAIGQSVMLDNGAYSKWRADKRAKVASTWAPYYRWCEEWLTYPTTWAVIPDEIDAGEIVQDQLLRQWPFKHRGVPVWHMDEPIRRLLRLCDEWPKVAMGSTDVYSDVLSPAGEKRMDEAWDAIALRHRLLPWIHMLRGLTCSGRRWPFASADSTDIARNHNAPHNVALAMANRWDAHQCPNTWHRPEYVRQGDLFANGQADKRPRPSSARKSPAPPGDTDRDSAARLL